MLMTAMLPDPHPSKPRNPVTFNEDFYRVICTAEEGWSSAPAALRFSLRTEEAYVYWCRGIPWIVAQDTKT